MSPPVIRKGDSPGIDLVPSCGRVMNKRLLQRGPYFIQYGKNDEPPSFVTGDRVVLSEKS